MRYPRDGWSISSSFVVERHVFFLRHFKEFGSFEVNSTLNFVNAMAIVADTRRCSRMRAELRDRHRYKSRSSQDLMNVSVDIVPSIKPHEECRGLGKYVVALP